MVSTKRTKEPMAGLTATDDGYQFAFDPIESDLVARLSLVFESLTGIPATKLPPLYDFVDPDALVQIFTDDDEPREDLLVSFQYLDYTVELTGTHTGRILT